MAPPMGNTVEFEQQERGATTAMSTFDRSRVSAPKFTHESLKCHQATSKTEHRCSHQVRPKVSRQRFLVWGVRAKISMTDRRLVAHEICHRCDNHSTSTEHGKNVGVWFPIAQIQKMFAHMKPACCNSSEWPQFLRASHFQHCLVQLTETPTRQVHNIRWLLLQVVTPLAGFHGSSPKQMQMPLDDVGNHSLWVNTRFFMAIPSHLNSTEVEFY